MACSIGWAIPSFEYKHSFEGYSIRAIQHHIPTLVDADTNALMDLQRLHALPPDTWHQQFREVFAKYKIQFPNNLEYFS